jgi:hypothetical protein
MLGGHEGNNVENAASASNVTHLGVWREKNPYTDIKNKFLIAPWEDSFLVKPAPYHPGVTNGVEYRDLIVDIRSSVKLKLRRISAYWR